MSYIINGTEVKVGQIWEQRDGNRCEIVEISFNNFDYPIAWVSWDRDDSGSVDSKGFEYLNEESPSDLIHCIVESEPEPVSAINQPKEQSVKSTAIIVTDLRNEEPEQNTEYKTWGDLPDGTAVLAEFGELFIVNKYADIAAVSIDGNYVRAKRDTLEGCTQVQIEIQIKKTIRTL